MSLLISEPPLQVLPSLAVEIGLNEAVILQQVHYWVLRSNFEYEGSKWVYNTLEQWQEQFPFWSSKTIQRTLQSLRQSGYLKAKKLSQTGCDHTLYYTIDYDLMSKSNWTNCPEGLGQIDQNTIYTETTTDINKPRAKKSLSLSDWIAQCKEKNERPIPDNHSVYKYADSIKLPDEFVRITWFEFKSYFIDTPTKKQKDWRMHFANFIRANYLRIWYTDESGEFKLTSRGLQAKKAMEATT